MNCEYEKSFFAGSWFRSAQIFGCLERGNNSNFGRGIFFWSNFMSIEIVFGQMYEINRSIKIGVSVWYRVIFALFYNISILSSIFCDVLNLKGSGIHKNNQRQRFVENQILKRLQKIVRVNKLHVSTKLNRLCIAIWWQNVATCWENAFLCVNALRTQIFSILSFCFVVFWKFRTCTVLRRWFTGSSVNIKLVAILNFFTRDKIEMIYKK